MKNIIFIILLFSSFAFSKTNYQVYRMPPTGGGNIASFGQITLSATAAVVGTLSVSNGGSGANIFNNGALLQANGISAFSTISTLAGSTTYLHAPTITVITATGAGVYNLPSSPSPLYLRVQIIGAGGGGQGGSGSGVSAGSASTFSTLLTASGGSGGSNGIGGSGGACTQTIPAIAIPGGTGSAGAGQTNNNATFYPSGGSGGNSFFGGSGGGGVQQSGVGLNAAANTGAGGGGGSAPTGTGGNYSGGGGGGAGCYLEAYISNPLSSYSYSIGTGTSGSSGGSGNDGNGGIGGNAANGMAIISAYYQ